jgi:hypothetical protein
MDDCMDSCIEAQWKLYIGYMKETLDYNITIITLTIIPLTIYHHYQFGCTRMLLFYCWHYCWTSHLILTSRKKQLEEVINKTVQITYHRLDMLVWIVCVQSLAENAILSFTYSFSFHFHTQDHTMYYGGCLTSCSQTSATVSAELITMICCQLPRLGFNQYPQHGLAISIQLFLLLWNEHIGKDQSSDTQRTEWDAE